MIATIPWWGYLLIGVAGVYFLYFLVVVLVIGTILRETRR